MWTVEHGNLGPFSLADARDNMAALRDKQHLGQLVAVGINPEGEQLHIVTAITGRSAPFQNQAYVPRGDSIVFGEAADPPDHCGVMTRLGDWHIATNGDQTGAVFDALVNRAGSVLSDMGYAVDIARRALETHYHEPDTLQTPRISLLVGAGLNLSDIPVMFSGIRRNPEKPEDRLSSLHLFCQGSLKRVLTEAGVGLSLMAYEGSGESSGVSEGLRPVVMGKTAAGTLDSIGSALDVTGNLLLGMAAKAVDLRTGRVEATAIFNRYGISSFRGPVNL